MSRPLTKCVVYSALVLACLDGPRAAAGDCGCEYQPPCRTTVEHVHRHVFRHCGRCNSCPPTGMVVPSVAAMPMAAMPIAAMPMMAAYQVQAPTYAPQAAPQRSTCGSDASFGQLEQTIARAIIERAVNGNGSLSPAAALSSSSTSSLEAKLERLDQNLSKLVELTEHMSEQLNVHDSRIKALEKR